jgi:outer membrane receptor protein involved in Fe transport
MSKFRLLLITIFVFVLIPSTLTAQSTGKISGKITDASTGEAIPFANVFVEGTSTGAAADIDGNYTILNLAPGLYSVTASVVGYQKVTVQEVRVNVDFTTRLNFELSSGAVDLPAVIVQGERNPLIRQDLTNPTIAITEETLQELPVNQISDVIKLQAGVVEGDDGNLHVRGGYGNEIAFTLNGITLNDPYGNTNPIGVATNAIQEVSVSTGTFAAQYGNALSGVVNFVTKEGGERYSIGLRGYAGDFLTNRTELFSNLDDIDPLNRARLEGTFGGPFPFIKDARFYVSSVYENFNGSLYGIRLYRPTDSHLSRDNFTGSGDERSGSSTAPFWFNPYNPQGDGLPTGDRSYVPMNTRRDLNIQGNVSYKLTSLVKIKYEAVYDKGQSQSFSNAYKYNPDGRGTNYSEGLIQSFDVTHTVNDNIFYTLKFSHGYNDGHYYLYEDVDDPRYLPTLYRNTIGNTVFLSGGTDNYREFRKTTTMGAKGDVVAQMFTNHEVKAGFEVRAHTISLNAFSVEIGRLNSDGTFGNLTSADLLYGNPTILRRKPNSPALFTTYERDPIQVAGYVQDKIELAQTLILNVGLRYEYFDPNAFYNTDLSNELMDFRFGNLVRNLEKVDPKHTLSPRVSVSYPITDRGVIRFSYGHFYQNGSLSSLYRNNDYYVLNFGETPTFGNPNVEPQKSIQYEIGLQQQLTEDFKFDLTGFYKDVSNYIYTQTIYTPSGRQYNLLTNLAYSNVRGITLSFLKRRAPGSLFSASLDYTFSIAEGNRTEPSAELFFSEEAGKQTESYLVPLNFDRRHVLNGTIALNQPDNWSAGVVVNFQTGSPYTPNLPSSLESIRYEQNFDNQPIQWNVDFKFEKFFAIGSLRYSIFLQVENVFDTQNELLVYASSGRALSNVEETQNRLEFSDMRRRINSGHPGLFRLNQIENYYSLRPERVNRPREVRLGFSFLFN